MFVGILRSQKVKGAMCHKHGPSIQLLWSIGSPCRRYLAHIDKGNHFYSLHPFILTKPSFSFLITFVHPSSLLLPHTYCPTCISIIHSLLFLSFNSSTILFLYSPLFFPIHSHYLSHHDQYRVYKACDIDSKEAGNVYLIEVWMLVGCTMHDRGGGR